MPGALGRARARLGTMVLWLLLTPPSVAERANEQRKPRRVPCVTVVALRGFRASIVVA